MSATIELVNLRRSYGNQVVVRDLTLTVAAGEFLTLLGSSGSGKTTTLMMIAGFVEPDAGEIRIGGRSILGLPPERRDLGVVFQSYALFPHMSVAQNVSFPLRMRRMGRADIDRKVKEALRLVDLADFGERKIGQLSGGQQQRVALARALVFEPPVLLMDEPLGALDRKLREQLQGEIKRIQQTLGLTVVYVTHDQEEALVLSDRVAIMADGDIQQHGPPAEIYERPANDFVARFLGESNFLNGHIAGEGAGRLRVELDGGSGTVEVPGPRPGPNGTARLMVRPESFFFVDRDGEGVNAIRGRIKSVEFLGPSIRYTVETKAGSVLVRLPRGDKAPKVQTGAAVLVGWRPEDTSVFP